MRSHHYFSWYRWSFIALFIVLSSLCLGDLDCHDDDYDYDYVTTPDRPHGREEADIGEEVTFFTGGSYSNLDDPIQYRIDFGDGTISAWTTSGEAKHTYEEEGVFPVSAQAKCESVTSSWSRSHYIEIFPAPVPLSTWQSVCGANDGMMWVVGKQGYMACYNNQTKVSHFQATSQNLYAITSSGDILMACGQQGTILQKIGTQPWQVMKNPCADFPILHAIALCNNLAVVVGGQGTIWQRKINGLDRFAHKDDGMDWQTVETNTKSTLYGVWLHNEVSGFAVGAKGTILYWNGQNWLAMPCPTQETLHAVWGSSYQDVWAVGQHGTILHFNGSAWQLVPSPTTANLRSIHGIAHQQLWIAADDGSLLGTRLDTYNVLHSPSYPWQTIHTSCSKNTGIYVRPDGKQIIIAGDEYQEIDVD